MEQIIKFVVIYGITIIRYVILAGLPFVIFYILKSKKFEKNKIQEKIATKSNFLNEVKHSLQSSVVLTLIGFLFLFTPLKQYTKLYTHISDYPIWWIPVSLLIALIIHDTYFYWMHRVLHHKNLFNKAHIVHHYSTNPSPWAAYSFHLIEGFAEALALPIVLITLPMHPITLFSFTVTSLIINVYGHLGYEIAPKWFRNSFLFEILNTSIYHNLHHHKFKGNYGLYFRIWDRICKTENPDYVAEYDKNHIKRFGSLDKTNNFASKSFFLSIGFILLSTLSYTQNIEGMWKDPKTGAIVEIFKQNDMYFGKAISSGNKEEDEKIKNKKLLILKDFKQEQNDKLCCGTIYLPRKKITAKGQIKMLSKDKIKVSGSYN